MNMIIIPVFETLEKIQILVMKKSMFSRVINEIAINLQ